MQVKSEHWAEESTAFDFDSSMFDVGLLDDDEEISGEMICM